MILERLAERNRAGIEIGSKRDRADIRARFDRCGASAIRFRNGKPKLALREKRVKRTAVIARYGRHVVTRMASERAST